MKKMEFEEHNLKATVRVGGEETLNETPAT
jgi:hypothetical protein